MSPTASTSSVRGHGEAQLHIHARRIALDRRVDEGADFGEIDDLVQPLGNVRARHAQNRAVQIDVLATGQKLVEARADLQQAGDVPLVANHALRGRGDAGNQLEQRALSRAVAADQRDGLPALHLKAHVAQGVERLAAAAAAGHRADFPQRVFLMMQLGMQNFQIRAQGAAVQLPVTVLLGYVFHLQYNVAHIDSSLVRSCP